VYLLEAIKQYLDLKTFTIFVAVVGIDQVRQLAKPNALRASA
jgi:hypothetical protein